MHRRFLYGLFLGMPCLSLLVMLSQIRGFDQLTITVGLYLYPLLGVLGVMLGYRFAMLAVRGYRPTLWDIFGLDTVRSIIAGDTYHITTETGETELQAVRFKDGLVSGAVENENHRYWLSFRVDDICRIEQSRVSLVDRCRAWGKGSHDLV